MTREDETFHEEEEDEEDDEGIEQLVIDEIQGWEAETEVAIERELKWFGFNFSWVSSLTWNESVAHLG